MFTNITLPSLVHGGVGWGSRNGKRVPALVRIGWILGVSFYVPFDRPFAKTFGCSLA